MNTELILDMNRSLDKYYLGSFDLVEQNLLNKKPEEYSGLNADALMTSYLDYYNILIDIPKGETLVDLGAGYARGVFLSESLGLFNCIGIESVKERVEYARSKLQVANSLILGDLSSVDIPRAYAYYLYFPKGKVFNKILRDLYHYSHQQEVYLYVCESHGDVIEYLNRFEHIFELEKEIRVSLPRHHEFINKYRVKPLIHNDLTFPEIYLTQELKNKSLIIDYFDRLKKEHVDWHISLEDFDLIIYNGKFALQSYESNRIIEIYRDEPIKKIIDLAL